MLNLACDEEKISRVPKIHFLKEPQARKGFLEHDKFDELLSHIPVALKPLIIFLYCCGVRVGEALQIEWPQVDLKQALIRLEPEQTKTDEARIVPLPDVLMEMLQDIEPKRGTVFVGDELRSAWQKACTAAGLGTLTKIEGRSDKRYNGLLIHDLRRSAIRNLIAAGVPEKVAMSISGHKTLNVFDRYNIVNSADVLNAMRQVQSFNAKKQFGESSVRALPRPKRAKLLNYLQTKT